METVAAPSTFDGTGSALRRAYAVPGAPDDALAALLRRLDQIDFSPQRAD